MNTTAVERKTISLKRYGIDSKGIHYQLTPGELQSLTLKRGEGTLTDDGVLAIQTGRFTGRAPKDRYIVIDDRTRDNIDWGKINIPFDTKKFDRLYARVAGYLSSKEVFVRDAYACSDEDYRMKIRVINETPWANLFVHNMFLPPKKKDLQDFQEDWLVLNAPGFDALPEWDGTSRKNFSIINFTRKIIIIGGTGYTGEIKKGIFSVLNYLMPIEKNVLPMHCSANLGANGDIAIFFGLSGTGKTTLSTDGKRTLIGDDEHGWTPDNTIFNFEGGCYAKVIDISRDSESEIFHAISPGALLENVVVSKGGMVDFTDDSLTRNTRVSYPITHIRGKDALVNDGMVKNIFFLSADAFGVLPPISRLTPEQASYYFLNGYTSKVAGTEHGVVSPEPSFSACFGAPFMPLHPIRYAEMLIDKIKRGDANVWLINTGWIGGPYGTGRRIALKNTRALVEAVHAGVFEEGQIEFQKDEILGLSYPLRCPGVAAEIMDQSVIWESEGSYREAAGQLMEKFKANFKGIKPL